MTNVYASMLLFIFVGTVHGAAYSDEEIATQRTLSQRLTNVTAYICQLQRLMLLHYSIDLGATTIETIIKRSEGADSANRYTYLLKDIQKTPSLEALVGTGTFIAQSEKIFAWLQAFPDAIAVRNQLYYTLRLRDLSQEGKEFEVSDGQLHKIACNPFTLQYFCAKRNVWRFLNYEVPPPEWAVDYNGWGLLRPAVGRKVEQLNITYGGTRTDGSCKKIRFKIKCKDEQFPRLAHDIDEDLRVVKNLTEIGHT